LDGDEATAQVVMSREFERFKAELDADDQKASGPKVAKIFTLWLYPPGAPMPPTPSGPAPIPIHLPWAADPKGDRDLLFDMVHAEVEALYARKGMDGVRQLLPSLEATYDSYRIGPLGYLKLRNAVPFEPNELLTAHSRVSDACGRALGDLESRRSAAQKQIGPVAATLAVGRLAEARREVESESSRYLTGRKDEWARGLPFSGSARFEGSEVRDLVAELRDLQRARSVLQQATNAYRKQWQDNLKQVLYGVPAAGARTFTLPTRFTDPDVMMAQAYPQVVADVRTATEDLALALLVYGRRHPVLFRFSSWPEIAADVRTDPVTGRLESQSGQDVVDLGSFIEGALADAWVANANFAARIEGDPKLVWRYPPLVQAALDRLEFTFPSVEYQAAQERIAEATGTSFLAGLGMAVGAVDVVVALFFAVPWVGLALAAASLLVGTAGVAEEVGSLSEQDDAFKAVLDPSRALAVAPDYTGLLVGVALSLLDLQGVSDAVRAVRVAQDAKLLDAAIRAVAL
jgi:hypothetical protein